MKRLLLLLFKKCVIFFFSNRLFIKFLYFSKLFFDYIGILNYFIFIKITKIIIRTKNIEIIDKKKFYIFVNKLKKSDFINLFLLSLLKIFTKILKIIFSFVGFIIYAIWSYLNTILLYAIGYILLEFGATRIYDPNQDITSREIWQVISKKLHTLKKKYFSKKYIFPILNVFYKKLFEKIITIYNYIVSMNLFIYYKLFSDFKNINFKSSVYVYIISFVLLYIINIVLFFKKIFYFEKFKKELNFSIYNFKKYVFLNYLNFFINLFKKDKIFFLNKKFFIKKKLLNLINYKTYAFNFKIYLKIKNKLKYQMLFLKNVFQFNRFKIYFGYRIKFWSTQKRFLHFYIKLIKKSKKIKMGALRVIYIEEWWIYKFYLKNYYFSSFLKIVFVVYNLVKSKVIFMFLYLNFIINFIIF